jgi:hypothetical protein
MPPQQTQREKEWEAAFKVLQPWFEREAPKMGNVTPVALIDDIGPLKALRKDIEKVEKLYVDLLKAKLGREIPWTRRGDTYEAVQTLVPRRALNQQKAKDYLESQGILDDFMDDAETPTVNVKRF